MADNDLDMIPVRDKTLNNVSDIKSIQSKINSSSFQKEFDILRNERLRTKNKFHQSLSTLKQIN